MSGLRRPCNKMTTTTTNLRKKAKQYGIKGYTKMPKEELLKHIYVDKESQTDGAVLSRELRKFTLKEQVNGIIDDLSWRAVITNLTCTNYTIFDEVRMCTECGDTKGIVDDNL